MRAKGLSGPLFAKHAGIKGLSKSVGNYIANSSASVAYTIDTTSTTIDTTAVTLDKTTI